MASRIKRVGESEDWENLELNQGECKVNKGFGIYISDAEAIECF